MKKLKHFSIFILVGILLFSLLFPACGKDNQSGSEGEGTLYTLAQAYEEGLITREHLLNIAYYQGSAEYNQDEIDENFTPQPKGKLTANVSLQLRSAIADMHRSYKGYENVTAEGFSVTETSYYGCYNGYHAFFFKDISGIGDYLASNLSYQEEIDGVIFYFNFPARQTIYMYG